MAKKRVTLPKEFDSLLKAGDIPALKKLFDRCCINAVKSKYSGNAFEASPLPREFAFWLKEQGCDVNQPNYYGRPPLFHHASVFAGDVPLLLELGADPHIIVHGTTALHLAATYGRETAVAALLAAGVDVNAGMDRYDGAPLCMMLRQGRGMFTTLASICKVLLAAGAEKTEKQKEAVARLDEQFAFHKSGIEDEEFLQKQETGMAQLCEIYGLERAAQIVKHDGISPIAPGEFHALWEYLVPASGKAKSAQGEVVRIAGRIRHEANGNGFINWDADFRSMLAMLPRYFALGNPLCEPALQEVAQCVRSVRQDGVPEKLIKHAVAWVNQNSTVLPVLEGDYKR